MYETSCIPNYQSWKQVIVKVEGRRASLSISLRFRWTGFPLLGRVKNGVVHLITCIPYATKKLGWRQVQNSYRLSIVKRGVHIHSYRDPIAIRQTNSRFKWRMPHATVALIIMMRRGCNYGRRPTNHIPIYRGRDRFANLPPPPPVMHRFLPSNARTSKRGAARGLRAFRDSDRERVMWRPISVGIQVLNIVATGSEI